MEDKVPLLDTLFDHAWVFTAGGIFPAGIFTELGIAEKWIRETRATGCLTKYPVNTSLYDYSIAQGWFTPKRDDQRSPEFITKFSCASAEHFHYEDGESV